MRNVDGINNNRGAIMHQVKVNVYYKNHIERMRIDVCNLGRTNIILDILWLQAYNPEINWEIEEVRMTRCPLIYGRNLAVKRDIKKRKKIEKRVRVVEKANRDK